MLRHHGDAKGSDHTGLANQLNVDSQGNDAIERIPILKQRYGKQILVFQIGTDELLHGIHQRVGSFLIIQAFGCGAVGVDDLPQRLLCLVQHIVHPVAGGGLELQADRRLGLEQNGHIHPQETAVRVHIQCQLLLKVQIGRDGSHDALGRLQCNRNAHADAGGGSGAIDIQNDVQLGIVDNGGQRGQRIGVRPVLLIQHPLGFLIGHDRHQHLRLQFIVGGQLAGDGFFHLSDLLVIHQLLNIHFFRGVNIQFFDIGLGVRVGEGHFTGAVFLGGHGFNFREQHITRQIAALPCVDGGFIPVDFAIVEHDSLLRLEIHLSAHHQLAGNHGAIGAVILHNIANGAILGIIGFVLHRGFAYRGVVGHPVPQNIGQSLGELHHFDLLTENAHRQGVDILRISRKPHTVLCNQGESGAGGKAGLAVKLRAVIGFTHGDFRGLQAGTGFHCNILFRLGCGHALGQHQTDGRGTVGKFKLSDAAVVFLCLFLIGGIHGIKGHALLDGIGVAKTGGAFLIYTPAHKGIALFRGVQALHRLGQQVLTLGEHHRLQFTAAKGFKGDNCRFGFVHESGIQRCLPIHRGQPGNGGGIFGILVPCGKELPLQGGNSLRKVNHPTGGDLLGFNGCSLGNERDQPLAQYKVHLLAGLQLHHLGIGAGHFKGFLRFIDHGTSGADGQGAHSLLHTDHTQCAAALDNHLVGTLYNNLGKLRAGIHMEVDHVGLHFFLQLFFLFHRSIMDMYTGDLAFAQVDAALSIQRKCRGLDGGQRQLLCRRNCEALRQHGGDGKVIAHDGNVARLALPPKAVDGFLRIHHGGERNFHQLQIFLGSDGRGRIDLRGFLGQIPFLCEDGQIDAVVLETQIGNTFRMRGKIDVRRVFDDIAQHSGNLLACFGPCDLLCKGKHLAGGLPVTASHLCEACKADVGNRGDHQDHRNDSSEI